MLLCHPFKWGHASVYLKGNVIFSRSTSEHVAEEHQASFTIMEANLTLKWRKGFYFNYSNYYIGHMIRQRLKKSSRTVGPSWIVKPQANTTKLCSCLRFRSVCQNGSYQTLHHSRTTKRKITEEPTEVVQHFDYKRSNCNENTSESINFTINNGFISKMKSRHDRCRLVQGPNSSVLQEEQPDKTTKAVEYLPQSLTEHEQAQNAAQSEFLAILWSVLISWPYLRRKWYTIPTDRDFLKWVSNLADANTCLVGVYAYWNFNWTL